MDALGEDAKLVNEWLEMEDSDEVVAFYASIREAGKEIEPDTAEIFWCCVNQLDRYGIYPDLELCVIGRSYFACNPEKGVLVGFRELPNSTRVTLSKRLATAELWPPGYSRSTWTYSKANGSDAANGRARESD